MTIPPDQTARTLAGSAGGNTNISNDTLLLMDGLDASRLLSISPRKLGQLVAADAIPSVKIGALRRFAPADLAAWIRCGCPTEPGSAEYVRDAMCGTMPTDLSKPNVNGARLRQGGQI